MARLFGGCAEDDQSVHLIVECKGAPDEQSRRKHLEVQSRWIPAVQSSRQLPNWLRRWHFAELTDRNLVGVHLDNGDPGGGCRPPASHARSSLMARTKPSSDAYAHPSASRSNLPTEQTAPLMGGQDRRPVMHIPDRRGR